MKKMPPAKTAPMRLDYVIAHVFDMYRELASVPATISARRGSNPRASRKPRAAIK